MGDGSCIIPHRDAEPWTSAPHESKEATNEETTEGLSLLPLNLHLPGVMAVEWSCKESATTAGQAPKATRLRLSVSEAGLRLSWRCGRARDWRLGGD